MTGVSQRAYRYRPEVDAPTVALDPARRGKHRLRWHAGVDLGLLALRLVLSVVFIGHGVQHLFGALGGPGMTNFGGFLAQHGFRQSALLAGLTGMTELGGGVLVLLGLCTPLAAAGLLGVMINVVWLKLAGGFFLGPAGQGFEYEFVLGGAALALVFAGGGRIALDRMLPMFRRPSVTATPCLLIGVGAAVAVRLLLHG